MKQVALAGVLICVVLFGGSFVVSGNGSAYFNLVAFTVVFSGTLGATLLSFPLSRLRSALETVRDTFTRPKLGREEIKDQLISLSVRSACQGSVCYEEIEKEEHTDPYLREAVSYLADNYSLQEIQEIMSNRVNAYSFEKRQNERVFRRMAGLAPAFGIAGSVIGLIGMLMGIGETELILKQIPIALVSTLYGIVLSNFVLTPMAESIASETSEELLKQRMVYEGVKAVCQESHPYKLARRLAPFLPGKVRGDDMDLIREKRRVYLDTTPAAARAQG
jgi:chemotaxis protein MotA